MKKSLLILAAGVLFLGGCTPGGGQITREIQDYKIKEIEGCEYIEFDRGIMETRVYSLAHKGNCKYCIQRNNSNK